jgi:hypothetical protein
MNTAEIQIQPEQADELIALYCDWREECALVQAAYERFSGSSGPDRGLAFAAYAAALEREESAAALYAAHISLIAFGGAADGLFTDPRESSVR